MNSQLKAVNEIAELTGITLLLRAQECLENHEQHKII